MSKMIDLDALGKAPKGQETETPSPTANTTDVGLTVTATKAPTLKTSRSLTEIYSEQQKLIYLIDISGSMDELVAGAATVDMFHWSSGTMAELHRLIQVAVERVADCEVAASHTIAAAVEEGADIQDDVVMQGLNIQEPTLHDQTWASLAGLTDDELKLAVVRKGLFNELYIPSSSDQRKLATKLGLVKKMAARMIDERLEKYPDADIMCATFDTSTEILDAKTKTSMLQALENVSARGGTNIDRALRTITEACKARPSGVNLHHIVLVSDGEDPSVHHLMEYLPALKAAGVVLDFIYISQPLDSAEESKAYYRKFAEVIKKVCEATNGTYTVVTNAEDFTNKFITASTRLMLPPASE